MAEKPKRLKNINWDAVLKIAKSYTDYVDSEEYHEDNDYEGYIVETVLESIYGEKYYEWINKIT